MTLNSMIRQCCGLVGTKDVSDWEDDFLKSISEKTQDGEDTRYVTEKQIAVIERIFSKNFAG